MDYKSFPLLLALLTMPTTVQAKDKSEMIKVIYEAADHASVPRKLLLAICKVESSLNPNAINLDDGGSPSIGLCEIKYTTATLMGFKGKPKDLFNPKINAKYSALYLKYQLKRYRGDWSLAISAYNAGTATTKNPNYVKKVLKNVRL